MKVYQVIARGENHGSYEEYGNWTTPLYVFDSIEKAKNWVKKHLKEEEDQLKKDTPLGEPIGGGFIIDDYSVWNDNYKRGWSELRAGVLYGGHSAGSIVNDPDAFDETYYIREYELI